MGDRLTVSRRASIDIFQLRARIAALVCSEPWLEVCWEAVCFGGTAAGERPTTFLEKYAIYPPGGRGKRGMRQCTNCGGRWYPRDYVTGEDRVCLDCSLGEGIPLTDEKTHVSSTSSPTGIALQRLEQMRIRLIEARLAAEDEASLLREIRAYESSVEGVNTSSDNTKRHSRDSIHEMTC